VDQNDVAAAALQQEDTLRGPERAGRDTSLYLEVTVILGPEWPLKLPTHR